MERERTRTVAEVVGENAATLRKALGLSQDDVARAMGRLGFRWHRQTVTEVESGKRPVAIEELVALAAFFDVFPDALAVSPGSQVSYSRVRVGAAALPVKAWAALWHRPPELRPPEGGRRAAIAALMGTLRRPWSELWRRRGGAPGEAFIEARERILERRAKLPGPTFVLTGEKPMDVHVTRPPWSHTLSISLRPGKPYVARDDSEAEELRRQEKRGVVRRIGRQEAYRLRGAR